MARYFIRLAYRGSAYHGWQAQQNAHTVQAEIESVLGRRFNTAVPVTGAGRTDTGVHATDYYVHFDCPGQQDCNDQLGGDLAAMMPSDIVLKGLYPVQPDAHARFSATSRTYHYLVSREKDPFLAPYAWYYHRQLDNEAMNSAASELTGEHDFSSFEKTGSDNSHSICHVTEAGWSDHDDLLVFRISANRFLRNMVRAIVGTLVEVGSGKIPPGEIAHIMQKLDRSSAGTSAPAHGLFLTGIRYPHDIFIGNPPEAEEGISMVRVP